MQRAPARHVTCAFCLRRQSEWMCVCMRHYWRGHRVSIQVLYGKTSSCQCMSLSTETPARAATVTGNLNRHCDSGRVGAARRTCGHEVRVRARCGSHTPWRPVEFAWFTGSCQAACQCISAGAKAAILIQNRDAATQKLPPFVYQFYLYPNYPRILGVKVDLFWNGSESEGYNVWIVEMRSLERSQRMERVEGWGHANSATAPDVACPGNDNFNIWKLNPSFGGIWNASIRLRTGDAADEVCWREAVLVYFYSLSIVCTSFISWRSWRKSSASWFTIALSIQKWYKCNLYFFCAIMH